MRQAVFLSYILAKEQVRATFFVVGRQLEANKTRSFSLLKRMWTAGHVVGSHTFSHANLTALPDASIVDEMKRIEELICNTIGVKPALMRPPFGEIDRRTESVLESLGYTVVIWNVDSDDCICKPTRRASDPAKSYIILDHDTLHPSVAAQREIIKGLKAKGYTFGNMSECLGGAAAYKIA